MYQFKELLLGKKGPKNLGIGKPPLPPFGQCPKVSDFFSGCLPLYSTTWVTFWSGHIFIYTFAFNWTHTDQHINQSFVCILLEVLLILWMILLQIPLPFDKNEDQLGFGFWRHFQGFQISHIIKKTTDVIKTM